MAFLTVGNVLAIIQYERKYRGFLTITVDGELSSGQGSDHEQTGANAGVRALEAELLGDLDQAGGGALSGCALGLVDLGKHGVGWLGDDGGGETGDQTGTEVDTSLGTVGEGGLVDLTVDSLDDLLVHDELGHGVWDPIRLSVSGLWIGKCLGDWEDILLEQEGTETGVERADTLSLEHLAEATDQAVGVGGLGNETDTGSLKRAKGDIGEELGARGRGEVDGGAVVGGSLVADEADGLLLEELVTSELEGALEEVTGEGWAETGQESTSALLGDDLAESTDQATVVGCWVELDSGLDAEGDGVS